MKKTYIFIILTLILFRGQAIFGQFLQLTYPVFQGVYQRDASDNANIPVSGQVLFPTSTLGVYTIECITNRLNSMGGIIPGTIVTNLITNNTLKGYFNGSITRSKGWYSLQVRFTLNSNGSSSITSSKFGVGDVFIIAGQSNGQGLDNPNWSFPSTSLVPEWIVGNNQNWNCRKDFENIPSSMTKIDGFNRISPTGNSSWCYSILGKKISDVNGGMPVAFFNTAAGGSSVLNWQQSAFGQATLHPYTNHPVNGLPVNNQYCNNSSPYVDDPQFTGQPYIQLKNTLNWYVQLFGVRAILWHQGESDSDNNTTVSSTKVASTYTSLLNDVIAKSREHLGITNLSWMVANVSYTAGNTSGGTTPNSNASNVLNGQTATINGSTVRTGPLTDKYLSASTAVYRSDNTHFNEASSGGLTVLNNLWGNFIDPSSLTAFNRISPKPVPPISITQSGSTFTFSITPVSNADYCWTSGSTLAPPTNSFSCLSTGTSVSNGGGSVRCFIGTNNSTFTAKNWVSTGVVRPQNCPGCRESLEDPDETYGGINMKLYPNPSDKDFRVEFDVPEDDTHVKLEFFDMLGNSVKVIADGSHAKGHFTYPITESLPTGTSICQLKVGEIFISKKMIRVN